MAINEACQVWIEQRIKEELEDGGDKSLREIGRVIAAEIEKVFEAKVSPMTVTMKASRIQSVTNVTPAENQELPTVNGGDNGDIARQVERKVRAGKSIREASVEVADSLGKNPETVRKSYSREKQQLAYPTQAMNFAHIAISQLSRITKEDAQWDEALRMVEEWIETFRSKQ